LSINRPSKVDPWTEITAWISYSHPFRSVDRPVVSGSEPLPFQIAKTGVRKVHGPQPKAEQLLPHRAVLWVAGEAVRMKMKKLDIAALRAAYEGKPT